MDSNRSKIRAIVFDFGGVLLDWNPRHLYRSLFRDPQAMENFLTEIGFTEWNLQFDRGYPIAFGIVEHSEKFPHHRDLISAYNDRWPECIAGPIQGTVDLLPMLKEAGYALYGLSNWSAETFYRVRDQYPFFDLLDEIVLSGEVKLIKPDPQIFQLLLEKTGRKAEECVFIDDSAANVEAAKQLGFSAIRFETPEQLERALSELIELTPNSAK